MHLLIADLLSSIYARGTKTHHCSLENKGNIIENDVILFTESFVTIEKGERLRSGI